MLTQTPPDERTGTKHRNVLIGLVAAAAVVAVAAVVAFWPSTSSKDAASSPTATGTSGASPTDATAGDALGGTARVRLGVFRQTDRAAVDDFQGWLRRPVDYVVDFSARDTWAHIAKPDYLLKEWRGSPYRLVYAVPMLPQGEPASLSAGARGAYDRYYRTLAQRLVRYGQPDAILRVGWEFNLDSWPWSTDDEVTYKAYFRRIVLAMRAVPGSRFQIDWNPNNGSNVYDAQWYYPGDDLVDYVGVDAYDVTGAVYPYKSGCDAGCRTATQKRAWDTQIYGGERGLRYWAAFARQHGKPLSLPEWGLWTRGDGTGGGDDPYYIEQMHAFITDPANNVAYQAYFEYSQGDAVHSLRESFPNGAKEYHALFGGS